MTRQVRPMVFESRTAFPVSAACVIANGMRETLAALYQAPVDLRLFEPSVPSPEGWLAITDRARLYRFAGTSYDAALILRPAACMALASAAFGEAASGARTLSSVEAAVFDRIIAAIGGTEPVNTISGFLTYFEIVVERPVSAAIGIAVAAQGRPKAEGALAIEDFLDIEVEVRVRTEGMVVTAGELAALEPGAIVPITVSTGLTAVATLAGRPLARGECGVRNNRVALAIGSAPCTERGSEPAP